MQTHISRIGNQRWQALLLVLTAYLLPVIFPALVGAADTADGWIRLFNGKDLAGWRENRFAHQPEWKVEDGVLVGKGGQGYLATEKEFADFELLAEVRIWDTGNARGNSGIYFRCQPHRVLSDEYPPGYEAQCDHGDANNPTGSIYNLGVPGARAPKPAVKDGEWFTLRIVAQGNHLRTWVNGKPGADCRDPQNRYQRGYILLQLHHRTGVVEFRSLRIRELSANGVPSAGDTLDASIRVWVSSVDLTARLSEQPPLFWNSTAASKGHRIHVQPETTFQRILGMGSSFEPSTCWNLSLMSPEDRERTIDRLVNPVSGIGMNLMRICIGTPDFTGDPWYSYNDLPPGETDPELKRFSIEKDRQYILPILKVALQKNDKLLFFASPWSPPGWMKTTGTMIGGHLLPQWYAVYAEYFVRFIRAYEAEGIPIYAVTIQNEPGVDRAKEKDPNWFYPSCHWTAAQERDFIRDHLGPAFRRHGITTRIWCYDHNYNVRPRGDDPGLAYPRTILSDPSAAQFVQGVAFHGYAGSPNGMSVFQAEFPNLPLYFTEGSVFGLKGGVDLVEKLRNQAAAYNAWVTILDENGKPNNGPFEASRTIITLDSATRKPTEHFDYFLYGHFMKFIQRGALRVETTPGDKRLANVAFRNPDGSLVLIAINNQNRKQQLSVQCANKTFSTAMPPNSITTFQWF